MQIGRQARQQGIPDNSNSVESVESVGSVKSVESEKFDFGQGTTRREQWDPTATPCSALTAKASSDGPRQAVPETSTHQIILEVPWV